MVAWKMKNDYRHLLCEHVQAEEEIDPLSDLLVVEKQIGGEQKSAELGLPLLLNFSLIVKTVLTQTFIIPTTFRCYWSSTVLVPFVFRNISKSQ
nr:hypothetical protein [Escherichia coli]